MNDRIRVPGVAALTAVSRNMVDAGGRRVTFRYLASNPSTYRHLDA
jgi:hypothetical protein